MASLFDIDAPTAALISQLTLDDIAEICNASKGKAREGVPPSDANEMQRFFQDLELARSIDNALELDQPIISVLSVVEDGLQHDHAYAEALENGRPLPPQTELQRLLEDPDFLRLSHDVEDSAAMVTTLGTTNSCISVTTPLPRDNELLNVVHGRPAGPNGYMPG
ncbi:hypothetical protein B0H12DRAFT_1239667 [Mycena haematopus]|nr:hypothetical protein B0H12DRAFT_1239667 [Mycena haematopus]